MDGWVRVLRPFNSISVISRRWKGEHERLCAMKRRLGLGRISPPAGFEPVTPWSEVGSANRSATRTLRRSYGGTRTSPLLLRLSWCGCSSYLSSFMPVRAGPWQQKLREGFKPLRWDGIGDFWTFPSKTMWWTRRFATESRMQLECMMI